MAVLAITACNIRRTRSKKSIAVTLTGTTLPTADGVGESLKLQRDGHEEYITASKRTFVSATSHKAEFRIIGHPNGRYNFVLASGGFTAISVPYLKVG